MNYNIAPDIFNYTNVVNDITRRAARDTKEYYLRAGSVNQLPISIKALNFYAINKNIAVYMPHTDAITRSVDLRYQITRLKNATEEEEDGYFANNLLYSNAIRNNLQLEDTFAVHIIPVTGQINEFFENTLPEFVRQTNAQEMLNVSLALKLTPKHRVRVYTRNNHILVFTTKGVFSDTTDTDYLFYRKLWACIPLLRGWHKTKPELTELYKLLINDEGPEVFWRKLEEAYNAEQAIVDFKYKGIIDTFNNLNQLRANGFIQKYEQYSHEAERLLANYQDVLRHQRDIEQQILALNNTTIQLDTEIIKRLVDKKTVYAVDTHYLSTRTSSNSRLSYRCSSPLINFDKEAALNYYHNRISSNEKVLKKLYELLFVDEKIILNFDEEIVLNFTSITIQAGNGNLIHGNSYHDCFPNPHHYNHNCWGSYGGVIHKLFSQYKLEELFYQIKTAVGSLNFVDYVVMSEFISHLKRLIAHSYNPACFYWKEDGCKTLHTYSETYEHFIKESVE